MCRLWLVFTAVMVASFLVLGWIGKTGHSFRSND